MSIADNPWSAWLKENSALRMDATDSRFSRRARNIHLARYELAKQYCTGRRVLDAACGTGYGTSMLASVAASAVGIDVSAETIAYARAMHSGGNTAFDVSFVEMTRFAPAEFDVVVSFETVEHTLCPRSHVREIARLLNPSGGVAILSVPNGWGLTDHHFFDFDRDSFQQLLTPHFGSIEYFAQMVGGGAEAECRIVDGTPDTLPKAYCILAVCRDPMPKAATPDIEAVMEEIYQAAFARHNEFLTLEYRLKTGLAKRIVNRAKLLLRRTPT